MSSRKPISLIDLKSLQKTEIEFLFSLCDDIVSGKILTEIKSGLTAALLFFESSTRTRMSFETACARWGIHPLRFDGKAGTSLDKGETLEDTILNVAAMNPSVLVIRCGEDLDLKKITDHVSMPVLNAGWGRQGHPTQALLDAYTLRQQFGKDLKGVKVLLIGDIRHSRVATSHFELCEMLGYELALCGPKAFMPEDFSGTYFSNLAEGLKWADAAMALRVQLERHEQKHSINSYRDQFGLTPESVKALSQNGIILHPGPINQGTEMDGEVLKDKRCRVLSQVSNGVLLRQSLIYVTVKGGLE